MPTRTSRTSNNQGWPFRDPSNDRESSTSVNQRMISHLITRKTEYESLAGWQSRSLKALGIQITHSREGKSSRSMQEAARYSGLDPAFFAIAEAGDALPQEITADVLKALARGSNATFSDLESAVTVSKSSRFINSDGQIMESILTLRHISSILGPTAFKSVSPAESCLAASTAPEISRFSDLFDDEHAGISYSIGRSFENNFPYFIFYELHNPESPLTDWNVSVINGLEELASGTTDYRGLFTIPANIANFPPNTYVRLLTRNFYS